MKRLVACVLAAMVSSVLFADPQTYYVDPINGNDANNGEAETQTAVGVGPVKALWRAMELVESGDTVIALPGTFDDSNSEANWADSKGIKQRLSIPSGVTVESRDGAAATTIRGGTGVRGVLMADNTVLRGFTVSGANHGEYGGGVSAGSNTYVYDCIIRDNVGLRGGGSSGGCFVRCKFIDNGNATGGLCRSLLNGSAYSCLFHHTETSGSYETWGTYLRNCTFGPNCPAFRYTAEGNNAHVYNCLFLSSGAFWDNAYGHLHACQTVYDFSTNAGWYDGVKNYHTADENCRVVTLAELDLDENFRPRSKTSAAVDAGSNAGYALPAALADETGLDVDRLPRFSGKSIDVGAAEFDWREVFSADLANPRVTVTAATTNVFETTDLKVAVPVGGELSLDWDAVVGADVTPYMFTVTVTEGGGTLQIFKNGAEEAEWTITEAGKHDLETSSSESIALRFVFSGGEGDSGSAVLSGFLNSYNATIVDENGGLTIRGAHTGENPVEPGQPLTFYLSRNYNSRLCCKGFTVNGEFVSFDGHEDGWEWSWTVESRETSVSIVAVYGDYNDWYVDCTRPDDSGNGYTPANAKRTLVGIMTNGLVAAGDVVHLAPGEYREGTMKQSDTAILASRIVIPAGITVLGDQGAEKTFIVGAEATGDQIDNPTYGTGANAVRCVYMKAGAKLRGVTVTGGRTIGDTSVGAAVDRNVGGIYGDGGDTYVENCVISNNVGVYGAGANYVLLVSCKVLENHSLDGAVCGLYYGSAVNTVFRGNTGGRETMYSGCILNCTFGDSERVPLWAPGATYKIYNNLIIGDNSGNGGVQKNCVLVGGKTSTVGSVENTVVTNLAALALDGIRPTVASDLIRDKGDLELFRATYAAVFPHATESADELLDAAYGQRVYNGQIDIGAFEFDVRDEFSGILASDDVTVTAVTPNVTKGTGKLVIPSGEALSLDWAHRVEFETTTYEFNVKATGDGVLKVFVDDAAGPQWTLTAEDGEQWLTTSRAGNISLRFVCEGTAGAAEISRFFNAHKATITVADKGVVLDGVQVGDNLVAVGESLAFTIRRGWDSTYPCTGIRVNGEFLSFDDYPSGWTHTVDSADSSVVVEAVYEHTHKWYVDANGGDDGNSGFATNNAKRTLAAVVGIAAIEPGDTIYALPGRYRDGDCGVTTSDAYTHNRVIVPADVSLVSTDGAEKTFIHGASATEPVSGKYGCGPDAMRCVSGLSGSTIRGFTLLDGRTHSDADGVTHRQAGGGIAGGTYVDCIISNNVSAYRGGAANGGTYIRCKFLYNRCCDAQGTHLLEPSAAINCVFDHGLAACHAVYITGGGKIANCTFGSDLDCCVRYPGTGGAKIFDSVVLCPTAQGCEYFNCVFAAKTNTNGTIFHDCIQTNAEALALAADYAPLKGNVAIDAGRFGDYATNGWKEAIFAAEGGKDVLGGQRVYNGQIDLGAVEYDWRGDYAKDLGRRITVTDAAPGVVETEEGAVRVSADAPLTLVWAPRAKAGTKLHFDVSVTGTGSLAVTLDGEPLAVCTEGPQTVDFESNGQPRTMVFTFTGDGAADLSRFKSDAGALLLVR